MNLNLRSRGLLEAGEAALILGKGVEPEFFRHPYSPLHANRLGRGPVDSLYPDENTETESVGLKLGIDVNSGLPG